MKKISILFSAILGIFLMGSAVANSQAVASSGHEISLSSENTFKFESLGFRVRTGTEVNPKSIESFQKIFGDAPDVLWSKISSNHDRACFVRDGITVRAGFNKKGKLMYTLRYYTEEHLPKDVLFRVKDTYYGKNIFGVVEVSTNGKTAYLISLEDKTSWLNIKVLDDEMSEEKVMLKGN